MQQLDRFKAAGRPVLVTDYVTEKPRIDAFYEKALREGVICETLEHAGSFFDEAARLAEPEFPGWVTYQQACAGRVENLRVDYEKLLAGA